MGKRKRAKENTQKKCKKQKIDISSFELETKRYSFELMENEWVGLISDTHGILDSKTLEIMGKYEPNLILHAGDVGPGKRKGNRLDAKEVITKLNNLDAEVVAIRGNVDIRSNSRCHA